MPRPEPPGTLPTIEERIDADYVAANLDPALRAQLAGLVQSVPGGEQGIRLLPSQRLRGLVRQAARILQEAGLADTPLEQLERPQLQRLAAAGLALTELNSRQAAALDRLQADPPPYLTTVLGRPAAFPRRHDHALLQAWRDLAGRIESYRLQYAITDPTRALGPRPDGLTQLADRSRIATDIAWSAFGSLPDLPDHDWLNVVDQPDRDPANALTMLRDPTWHAPAALPARSVAALQASPSTVLRRRVEQALGLLRRRPPDRSEQRVRLRALHQQLTRLAGRPPHPSAAIAGKADERLREIGVELEQVEQEHRARLDWDATHRLTLAEGRIAAQELRRRELQALLEVAEDPPDWLVRELGAPPTAEPARTVWLGGARAIIAYRTTHSIEGPDPLGATPSDSLARIHYSVSRRHLDQAKQQLQHPQLERPSVAPPSRITVELSNSLDPPI
jgi:hypothetical protein